MTINSSPALELANLRAITDGNAALEAQLFELYRATVARCLEQLRQALETGVQAEWRAAAHEWKGAAANVGAMQLSNLCAEAELQAVASADASRELLNRIAGESARVDAAIAALGYN